MEPLKMKTLTGTFDFPIDLPFVIHEMPDGKMAFEIVFPAGDQFVRLLEDTPDCIDFRRLGGGKGNWVAYSNVISDDEENNTAIRAQGETILDALKNLRVQLGSTI